jgi:hypothetical protein
MSPETEALLWRAAEAIARSEEIRRQVGANLEWLRESMARLHPTMPGSRPLIPAEPSSEGRGFASRRV